MCKPVLNKKYLILAIVPFLLQACGSDPQGKTDAESVVAASAAPNDQNYVTASEMRLTDGSIVPAGANVTVLETKDDPSLGKLYHVGIDSDDESVPSDVWLTEDELRRAGLSADTVDEDPQDDIFAYDEASAKKMKGARKGGKHKMTYCYRFVKQYLMKTHKVKGYLPGGSAWMAAGTLPKYGYRKLKGGPASAQTNDVCVYRGGKGGNGHVEVKVSGGWYYGYGVKPAPITRVNHPFVGCYRK